MEEVKDEKSKEIIKIEEKELKDLTSDGKVVAQDNFTCTEAEIINFDDAKPDAKEALSK